MPLSIRLLIAGVALLGVGHLATPGSALAEPDTSAAWIGEPAAEPALAAPLDELGPGSLDQPLAADASAGAPDVDADLWAESFYPATSIVSVTAPDPALQPALAG